MVTKLTANIDSIVTKSNLPPSDVVTFSGNPCEYVRSRARFDETVGVQNISETQKMSHLLQFLDGQARSAVVAFEGVPDGLLWALKMLQQRFGQPHIVTKACVVMPWLPWTKHIKQWWIRIAKVCWPLKYIVRDFKVNECSPWNEHDKFGKM